MQFTINGQFQPELKLKPGQTEIWAVANISDIAYMTLRLTETATGNHPEVRHRRAGRQPLHAGAVDPSTVTARPSTSRRGRGTRSPSRCPRTAIWSSSSRRTPGRKAITDPGVLYTNNGTKNPPAVLGTVTVDPKYISYADGFFVFPTQTLIRATPDTAARADHGVRAGPEPRRVHVIRGHLGDDARRQAGDEDHRHHRRRQRPATTIPRPSSTSSTTAAFPNVAADPAAAELGRGMDDHQLQQRRPSDAHPRQRLSGDGDR